MAKNNFWMLTAILTCGFMLTCLNVGAQDNGLNEIKAAFDKGDAIVAISTD